METAILILQRALNIWLTVDIKTDGVLGPETMAAVRKFAAWYNTPGRGFPGTVYVPNTLNDVRHNAAHYISKLAAVQKAGPTPPPPSPSNYVPAPAPPSNYIDGSGGPPGANLQKPPPTPTNYVKTATGSKSSSTMLILAAAGLAAFLLLKKG